MRKSEAPGGCGWIVDFGGELGRQFFSTGGAGNVCHLVFANTGNRELAPSSPSLATVAENEGVREWIVHGTASSGEDSLRNFMSELKITTSQVPVLLLELHD